MRARAPLGAAILLLLAAPACTAILGDIDFEGSGTGGTGGAGGSTTATTTTTGGTGGSAPCGGKTCDPHATCDSSSGTPVCACNSGYTGNGETCADINECEPTDPCKGDTSCKNTEGSYECTCPDGNYEYPKGSGTCVLDPCQPSPCDSLGGVCDHDTGVAVCKCNPGWLGTKCDTCVRFVDASASGAKTGFSWADAYTAVQPAVETAHAAVAGGAKTCEVWVKKGTYYVYSSDPSDTIKLYDNIGLYGGFAGGESDRQSADPEVNLTTLSGKKSAGGNVATYHVVTIAGAAGVTVDGFTIQDGKASASDDDGTGAGVQIGRFNALGSATISHCVIAGNTASYAGGLSFRYDVGASVQISDCTFHDNVATSDGGALGCATACTVVRSVFRANKAKNGGAVLLGGVPTMTDCTIEDNEATGDAGGIYALSVQAGNKLENLVLDNNVAAGLGGGIYTSGGAAVLSNALIIGNMANTGGGIGDDSTNGVTCINCTITGNFSINGGDGIHWAGGAPTSPPKLSNSIVWGNPSLSPLTGLDIFPANWAAVSASHSDIGGYAGGDASSFDADPKFASMPVFYDRTTAVAGDMTSITVTAAAIYAPGDKLEIGKDGIARTVMTANNTTVTFTPALAVAAPKGVQVRNWSMALGQQNAHLSAGSPCINAGTAVGAPAKDLEDNDRVGLPDLGVYEHP